MMSFPVSPELHSFLLEHGFKQNGDDYWLTLAVTDLKNEWEEEVYVSNKGDHFEVWYPDGLRKDKKYKTQRGLIKYLLLEVVPIF